MLKNFDDLTIADDYIFYTVMQDQNLCKELLSMVLKNKIGTIVRVFTQKSIATQIASKGVRLDLMIEDDTGKLYDIEMQATDQKNLAKRMRYYQCAIDNSSLNKGGDYNDLPDSFIIFFYRCIRNSHITNMFIKHFYEIFFIHTMQHRNFRLCGAAIFYDCPRV